MFTFIYITCIVFSFILLFCPYVLELLPVVACIPSVIVVYTTIAIYKLRYVLLILLIALGIFYLTKPQNNDTLHKNQDNAMPSYRWDMT